MTIPVSDTERIARATLTWLGTPEGETLGPLVRQRGAVAVLDLIRSGQVAARLRPGPSRHAVAQWQAKLTGTPSPARIASMLGGPLRLACPGDSEWPPQLDVLGNSEPYALWLRGTADLRGTCRRSVAIVGSRASTAYGSHVAADIASVLAENGWAVVSGGAYGIDAAAHRGALAANGTTIAVLASGVDVPYPAGHADLFDAIAAHGLLVSQWPPGQLVSRLRFLGRNRIIAALATGTLVVEAGSRSGACNTARHARDLSRPLMAVPGPVTSDQSAGCHQLIRDWHATLVTGPADVIDALSTAQCAPPSSPQSRTRKPL
jgi:DNA processing protein